MTNAVKLLKQGGKVKPPPNQPRQSHEYELPLMPKAIFFRPLPEKSAGVRNSKSLTT
jgi:hypothetical protein